MMFRHSLIVLVSLNLFVLEFCRNLEFKKIKIYGTENQSFKLHCKNNTKGEFYKVVWLTNANSRAKYTAYSYNKKQQTTVHENFRGRVKRFDGTSIEILHARKEDSGSWECNIVYNYRYYQNNKKEERRKRVQLLAVYDTIVVSPPIISKVYPHFVAAPTNFQGSAFCDAYSLYPFNLTWVKINGEFTKYVTFNQVEKRVGKEYHKRSHILFDRMTVDDTGSYLCVAKNMVGQVSREVDVKLQARPKITSQMSTYMANVKDDGLLTCIATGYPKVTFTWVFMHNYEKLLLKSEDSRNGKFSVSKTKFRHYDGKEQSTSILTIKNVVNKDWRSYKCLVENSIGYDQKKFEFIGYDIPVAPALLDTEDIEEKQVTIHWLLDLANGDTESVVIEHKETDEFDWHRLEIYQAITSYTVINLEENVVYDFRVQTRNRVGLSPYSSVLTLQTKVMKEPKKTPQQNQKIIANLDLVSLTAICGGVVLFLTCLCATLCVIVQDKRYKKKRKRKNENKQLIALNHVS